MRSALHWCWGVEHHPMHPMYEMGPQEKKCSDIVGKKVTTADPRSYVCPRYKGNARPIDGRPLIQVVVDGSKLDVEVSFCYLRDMLDARGGCNLIIITRCSTAW